MKLIFFLIAFSLIFLRVYLGWMRHGDDRNDGNVTIRSDGLIEQMNWSGRIQISDDETAIKNISPGGYLKYRHNDKKMTAEPNTQGDIIYAVYDHGEKITIEDSSKKFITAAIKEMIAWGFDAKDRVERIYKKGGDSALLAEVENIKPDNVKGMYLDLLFKGDSLGHDDLVRTLNQINAFGSDADKARYLNKFTGRQLNDSAIVMAWLAVVGHFNADIDKVNLLNRLIEQMPVSEDVLDAILNITAQLGSDVDKANTLSLLIGKKEIPQACFIKALDIVKQFGADIDKANMYKKLMSGFTGAEENWIILITEIANISSDVDKSNLLVEISKNMPRTENVKSAYLKTAKTITADAEYGKAVRAAE